MVVVVVGELLACGWKKTAAYALKETNVSNSTHDPLTRKKTY